MRARLFFVGLALVAGIACSMAALAQSTAPAAPPVVWEYTSFQQPVYTSHGLEAAMNEFGSRGWDFVGAHTATVTQDDVPRPVSVYVFKRARTATAK